MSFSSSGSPPYEPAPSLEEIPTPTPDPEDEGEALGLPDASTTALSDALAEPILTVIESGADLLLSMAVPGALSDQYSSTPDGWTTSPPDVDAYSGAPVNTGTGSPYAGSDVDAYAGTATSGAQPNAFTGGYDIDPFSGLQNAAPPGARIDTSQMLASNGPMSVADTAAVNVTPLQSAADPAYSGGYSSSAQMSSSTPTYVPNTDIIGQPSLGTVTIEGTSYAHYQVTIDGTTYDAYANDMVLPRGQVWLVPAVLPAATTPSAPVQAQAPAMQPQTAQSAAPSPAPGGAAVTDFSAVAQNPAATPTALTGAQPLLPDVPNFATALPDATRVPSYLSTYGSLLDQGIRYSYAPRDASGTALQGPLNLYSGEQARIGAMNAASGYTIRQTSYYAPASAQEAALRAALQIPEGRLPTGPYNEIWGAGASFSATRDAALAGSVATHNDLATLPSDSIQAIYELPALKRYGGAMGGLGLVTGSLSVYGGTEEQNPTLSRLAIGGGSVEAVGGGMLLLGALRTSAPLMSYGRYLGTAGAVVTAPVVIAHAYNDITSDNPVRYITGSLAAAGLVFPPAGFLSVYLQSFALPAAEELYEILRRDIAAMLNVPRSWVY